MQIAMTCSDGKRTDGRTGLRATDGLEGKTAICSRHGDGLVGLTRRGA